MLIEITEEDIQLFCRIVHRMKWRNEEWHQKHGNHNRCQGDIDCEQLIKIIQKAGYPDYGKV